MLLKKRPAYYEHCIQEIFQARRVNLIRKFLYALTKGGPNVSCFVVVLVGTFCIDSQTTSQGHPKPIEIHAHDPARYISDMLAWVHQAVASERDFFQSVVAGWFPWAVGTTIDLKSAVDQSPRLSPTPCLWKHLKGSGSRSCLALSRPCLQSRIPVSIVLC